MERMNMIQFERLDTKIYRSMVDLLIVSLDDKMGVLGWAQQAYRYIKRMEPERLAKSDLNFQENK